MVNRASLVDGALAAIFAAACAWTLYVSGTAARGATSKYGRNVDSGVLEYATACFYFAPVAALFALAAVAASKGWRSSKPIHWVAFLAATVPLAWAAVN